MCSCPSENLSENSWTQSSCNSFQSNGAEALSHPKSEDSEVSQWVGVRRVEQEWFVTTKQGCTFEEVHLNFEVCIVLERAIGLLLGLVTCLSGRMQSWCLWCGAECCLCPGAGLVACPGPCGGTTMCISAARGAAGPRHLPDSSICSPEQHAAQQDLLPCHCWLFTFRHLLLGSQESGSLACTIYSLSTRLVSLGAGRRTQEVWCSLPICLLSLDQQIVHGYLPFSLTYTLQLMERTERGNFFFFELFSS